MLKCRCYADFDPLTEEGKTLGVTHPIATLHPGLNQNRVSNLSRGQSAIENPYLPHPNRKLRNIFHISALTAWVFTRLGEEVPFLFLSAYLVTLKTVCRGVQNASIMW